jgi:adenosine/AMP kinase
VGLPRLCYKTAAGPHFKKGERRAYRTAGAKDASAQAKGAAMEITTVRIERPETVSVILGQSHFIKTVEDIHEAMVNAVPGIKFGLAFCEASGDRLVRKSGTDEELIDLAARNALAVGAGHSFVLLLGEGFFPINVLNALKAVPEVCTLFCATANPVEAIVAETDAGRGLAGVIDGAAPLGIEDEGHVAARKDLLRRFGYKL